MQVAFGSPLRKRQCRARRRHLQWWDRRSPVSPGCCGPITIALSCPHRYFRNSRPVPYTGGDDLRAGTVPG